MTRKIYSWTGFAPREASPDRTRNVHCAVACRSNAEFFRLTGKTRAFLPYVSIMTDPGPNDVLQAAFNNPGTVYWSDTVRLAPKDAVVLPHPDPELS